MTSPTSLFSSLLFASSLGWLAIVVSSPIGVQAPKKTADPAQAFKNRCAKCHGANGQGGPAFAKPLTGRRSASELSRFIQQSMPPGPVKTPKVVADGIAAYMFDAFYSPIAQERNRPARVTLSRLTVKQYRNAVADLIGGVRRVLPWKTGHGLNAEYFTGRDFNGANRLINRVDPQVAFDFKTEGPEPKFDPRNFCAVWQGSVLAPDTGEYEFVVQSSHAVRLWLNGSRQPIADGWVRSTTENEFRGVVNLLGGRAYNLRLEFSKASPGVDDTEKKKAKPPEPSFVTFQWRRPHRALETIPSRYLFADWVGNTFVPTTPFPPDDRSIGYERGNTVSKAWDDAATAAALETAGYVSDHLAEITGIPDDAPDRTKKLQTVCRDIVQRAFRRPLTPELEKLYVSRQFERAATPELAVKRVLLMTLKSPRFLYREISTGPTDEFATAANLSFGLWDTLPDAPLLDAAAKGELAKPEQIRAQAERMVADPRAWTKLRDFLLLWLKIDEVPEIVKSSKRFPSFDATTVSDLRSSLELFLESTAGSERSDYRELLLGQKQFLNGRLAKLYGPEMPADADFQPVDLDPSTRAGVLTHPYVLSRFAYLETSSPIHRGVLIARNMLGRTLQPPPAAFAPIAASLHPNLTTRERVAMQTKPNPCNTCHSMINPLGFSLERFDAIGRVREKENGKPVDPTGSYRSRSGDLVKFAGATDLAKFLANSEEAHEAFVEKLFHHLVKQPVRAYGTQTMPGLEAAFTKNEYSIRRLMVEIMVATNTPRTTP